MRELEQVSVTSYERYEHDRHRERAARLSLAKCPPSLSPTRSCSRIRAPAEPSAYSPRPRTYPRSTWRAERTVRTCAQRCRPRISQQRGQRAATYRTHLMTTSNRKGGSRPPSRSSRTTCLATRSAAIANSLAPGRRHFLSPLCRALCRGPSRGRGVALDRQRGFRAARRVRPLGGQVARRRPIASNARRGRRSQRLL